MPIVWDNMLVAAAFTILGGVLGFLLMLGGVYFIPKIMERLTPNIDEEKEIAKGNLAVAHYFGAIIQATIIGMSIIIAAAILGGIVG